MKKYVILQNLLTNLIPKLLVDRIFYRAFVYSIILPLCKPGLNITFPKVEFFCILICHTECEKLELGIQCFPILVTCRHFSWYRGTRTSKITRIHLRREHDLLRDVYEFTRVKRNEYATNFMNINHSVMDSNCFRLATLVKLVPFYLTSPLRWQTLICNIFRMRCEHWTCGIWYVHMWLWCSWK